MEFGVIRIIVSASVEAACSWGLVNKVWRHYLWARRGPSNHFAGYYNISKDCCQLQNARMAPVDSGRLCKLKTDQILNYRSPLNFLEIQQISKCPTIKSSPSSSSSHLAVFNCGGSPVSPEPKLIINLIGNKVPSISSLSGMHENSIPFS